MSKKAAKITSAEDQDTREALFKATPDDGGESYLPHCIEIYKLYVSSAEGVSTRRQTANSFFLTLNTAILAFLGYVKPSFGQSIGRLTILATIAGIVLCYIWYRLILSYKGLNSGKFKVIHMIEARLPIAPFNAEWKAIGSGKDPKKYKPFTHVEVLIPWVFMAIYIVGVITFTPWRDLCTFFGIVR
jgi:hypothetical protein